MAQGRSGAKRHRSLPMDLGSSTRQALAARVAQLESELAAARQRADALHAYDEWQGQQLQLHQQLRWEQQQLALEALERLREQLHQNLGLGGHAPLPDLGYQLTARQRAQLHDYPAELEWRLGLGPEAFSWQDRWAGSSSTRPRPVSLMVRDSAVEWTAAVLEDESSVHAAAWQLVGDGSGMATTLVAAAPGPQHPLAALVGTSAVRGYLEAQLRNAWPCMLLSNCPALANAPAEQQLAWRRALESCSWEQLQQAMLRVWGAAADGTPAQPAAMAAALLEGLYKMDPCWHSLPEAAAVTTSQERYLTLGGRLGPCFPWSAMAVGYGPPEQLQQGPCSPVAAAWAKRWAKRWLQDMVPMAGGQLQPSDWSQAAVLLVTAQQTLAGPEYDRHLLQQAQGWGHEQEPPPLHLRVLVQLAEHYLQLFSAFVLLPGGGTNYAWDVAVEKAVHHAREEIVEAVSRWAAWCVEWDQLPQLQMVDVDGKPSLRWQPLPDRPGLPPAAEARQPAVGVVTAPQQPQQPQPCPARVAGGVPRVWRRSSLRRLLSLLTMLLLLMAAMATGAPLQPAGATATGALRPGSSFRTP
jgi:hypothetical protein